MTRLTFIPAPFVRIAMATRIDLSQFIVAGVINERVEVWKVNADYTSGGKLPFSGGAGKDDSVDVAILDDGSVQVIVSEAAGSGASGSTSQPDVTTIPGVFPPYSGGEPGPAGPQGPPGEVTRNYLWWDKWTAMMIENWIVTMRAVNLDAVIDERLRELGLLP